MDETNSTAQLRQEWFALSQGAADSPERRSIFELTAAGEQLPSPKLANAHVRDLSTLCKQIAEVAWGDALLWAAVMTPVGVLRPCLAWLPDGHPEEGGEWDLLENAPPLVVEVRFANREPRLTIAERARAYLLAG